MQVIENFSFPICELGVIITDFIASLVMIKNYATNNIVPSCVSQQGKHRGCIPFVQACCIHYKILSISGSWAQNVSIVPPVIEAVKNAPTHIANKPHHNKKIKLFECYYMLRSILRTLMDEFHVILIKILWGTGRLNRLLTYVTGKSRSWTRRLMSLAPEQYRWKHRRHSFNFLFLSSSQCGFIASAFG